MVSEPRAFGRCVAVLGHPLLVGHVPGGGGGDDDDVDGNGDDGDGDAMTMMVMVIVMVIVMGTVMMVVLMRW